MNRLTGSYRHRQCAIAALLLAAACVCLSCGQQSQLLERLSSRQGEDAAAASAPPSPAELGRLLEAEFSRLGLDPERVAAAAPKAGSEVFDLVLEPVFDGLGGPRIGVRLRWTERLVGDYDNNGEVGITDLTPIGLNFQQSVDYDPAEEHAGFAAWPLGSPLDDGGVPSDQAPAEDSGAANWRLARVDGDGNGTIAINDLTPIAVNWRARLDGYRVYRRREGESTYTLVPHPGGTLEAYSIDRNEAIGASGEEPDARRPVVYEFFDEDAGSGDVQYLVAPYDADSDSEGPLSTSPEGSGNVLASFTLTPPSGSAPLTVEFDASASVALLGTITEYRWDFYNDGSTDFISSDSPLASETFLDNGTHVVVLRVSNDRGEVGVAAELVQVGLPPQVQLNASPNGGEVPLSVRFDASASSSSGGIQRFEWDTDGDGDYDLNTGPVPFYDVACTAAGSLSIGVRVVDKLGLSSTGSREVELVDNYDEVEPNGSAAQAMPLGSLSVGGSISPLLCSLGQSGYDGDSSDWYRINTSSAGLLSIDLQCEAELTDLNVYVYDSGGSPLLASAVTSSASENLECGLKHGAQYFVECRRISGGSGAADYNLGVSLGTLPLDEIEPNNSAAEASNLGFVTGSNLPGFYGSVSPANSEDWYRFSVSAPVSLSVLLSFYHQDADLDLQVYDAGGTVLLGESRSVDDDELAVLPELPAGTYTIRCFRFQGGSAVYSLGFLLN